MFRLFGEATKVITNTTLDTVDTLGRGVNKTSDSLNSYIEPVRKSTFKRYPSLFTVLVAFGSIATFLGAEQLILKFDLLNDQPIIIFGIGIGILFFTGKLYKKLD